MLQADVKVFQDAKSSHIAIRIASGGAQYFADVSVQNLLPSLTFDPSKQSQHLHNQPSHEDFAWPLVSSSRFIALNVGWSAVARAI